jgi:hypothetical protein
MKLLDIYDPSLQDGKDNKEAFEALPKTYQYFFSTMQKSLCERVERSVVKQYGIIGLQSLQKTSGFRSHKTNARWNGKSNSLHLIAAAADFRKCGIFSNNPIPVCSQLECIDSGKCWHIQFKRS